MMINNSINTTPKDTHRGPICKRLANEHRKQEYSRLDRRIPHRDLEELRQIVQRREKQETTAMEPLEPGDRRVRHETTILDKHGDVYTDYGRVPEDVH